MAIYLIGFFSSGLIFGASNKIKKTQRWTLILIAILIPCFVAGLRDEKIGTDVLVYLKPMVNAALSSASFREYLKSRWFAIWRMSYVSNYEIGFSLVVYVIAKIFGNIYAVQFVLQILVVIPIYMALRRECDSIKKYIWLGMLTYYFMFFNNSLNMMRQSIAMAFVFLAYRYFRQNKKKKCVISMVIAVTFHTSAILGILIFALYKYVNAEKENMIKLCGMKMSGQNINMAIAMAGGIIAIVGINRFTIILERIGLARYVGYISGTIRFMPNQLISRLPAFILVIYGWKICGEANRRADFRFYITMLFFDLVIAQFTSVNPFAGRIGLYFSQFEMLAFPATYSESRGNKMILALLIGYMSFYWWFYYVLNGANATVPYVLGV